MEVFSSQISCKGCHFGSKLVGDNLRFGAEIVSYVRRVLQILHILLYGSLSGVQAISGTGASTVVIHRCRFEFMTYTALRISDSTMLSISHSMFDKNGSVLTLGEAGSGKPCHASERT